MRRLEYALIIPAVIVVSGLLGGTIGYNFSKHGVERAAFMYGQVAGAADVFHMMQVNENSMIVCPALAMSDTIAHEERFTPSKKLELSIADIRDACRTTQPKQQ